MDVSVSGYMDYDGVKCLCEDLSVPADLTERLLSHIKTADFSCLDPWINGLFKPETGGEAVKKIAELCKTEEEPDGDAGLKALAVYLAAALRTRDYYDKTGIGRDIFIETMKGFPRLAYEHMKSYGRYGFDRHFWIYRQLSASIFRLGVLEYEFYRFPENTEPAGPVLPGASALSVHIPSDAVMERKSLDNSYRMAKAFFSRFFPDFNYNCVYCSTWLLSPVLKQILKPGSRILNFQEDYEITKADLTVNGGLMWIYKKEYEDYNLLPEETSLMRGVKKILLSGGKTGSASGYVKDFNEK